MSQMRSHKSQMSVLIVKKTKIVKTVRVTMASLKIVMNRMNESLTSRTMERVMSKTNDSDRMDKAKATNNHNS